MSNERKPPVSDSAIERVAREMLNVEPASDLRTRVLAQIDAPHGSWRWLWIAVPFAAAAIVVLIVLLPRSRSTGSVQPTIAAPPPTVQAGNQTTPEPSPPAPPDMRVSAPPRRTARATSVEEPPPVSDEQSVAPLNAPVPISLPTIDRGRGTAVSAMELAPISVRPLAVDALDETPQSRH